MRILEDAEVAQWSETTQYVAAQQRWAGEREAEGIAGVRETIAQTAALLSQFT